ncbi:MULTISPECIES: replication initiator protein A [Sphingomonadaceae]|jgi:plasmid replication initiation protein|uniref:Replication initiator protein A n=1 Tax=Sphingomonas molluscorum TaxID=418184 RepID=A0ABU8Q9N8_9SPHN|nr:MULTISPECIES: replication initiator protein A [Sphingomonadaceae]MBM7407825.1 plasmid replication initiation protein [Sphingomonas sp. JUb134]
MSQGENEAVATVVGGRRVQFEMFFTLPDFSEISLRDYQETMQRPFFSLSKKKRVKPIEYVSPDKQVTVHVSANPEYGMATIWDADIMIYLASHLNELRERGDNDLSPTIRVQPGDLLKRICWGVSGRAYERLIGALDRLQATTIKTNIRANSKTRETTFSWIDSYTHLVDERTQRSLGMEITLSKWFFDGVMDKRNVLAISPLYFEITSGLGKWLYRASRKHAGGNGAEGFTIGFETLHQKSGSESSLPSFKNKILELARANTLPEINLEVIGAETPRPKLKMVMRRFMGGHQEVPSRKRATPPSPARSAESSKTVGSSKQLQQRPAEEAAEMPVDPSLVRSLVQRAVADLKATDPKPSQDPHDQSYAAAAVSTPRRRGGRAHEVLDPETYAAIKAECPGWDLDVLIKQFDAFLNSNPDEMPRNYSKRFYGFMKKHHERNKYTLPGF